MIASPSRILLASIALLALSCLAACGSSGGGASGDATTSTTAASGSADGSSTSGASSESGSAVTGADDPCSLYSLDDMKDQMGADDVTAEASDGISPTCTYGSPAHYLEAELAVLDADQMANTPRDPTAYLTGEAAGSIELLDVSGIGDEVFGSTSKGGVTMVVRVGEGGYSLLLTNAGGGPDAANWADETQMATSAKAILTSVIGE